MQAVADRQLSLNQQIALLPVAIPDAVLDFLEDFNYGSALQTETSQSSLDPDYWKKNGTQLKGELDKLRQDFGKLVTVQVDQGGREVPGAYFLRLQFEKAAKGMALLSKMKDKTILRVLVLEGDYDDVKLRELAKNPPKAE